MIPSELLLPSVTQTKTPTIALTTQTTTASIHNVESTLAQPTTISDNEPNTIPLMAGLITTCLLLALAVLTNIVLVMLLYKKNFTFQTR